MKIELRSFSGIAPRYSPELLNESNGIQAQNISIKSGKIHPEKPFVIKRPDRDYVPGHINDDQYHRLYFLDKNGTLSVCGRFPDSSGNISDSLSSRKVDISAPGKPEVISVSSPFLDSIGKNLDGKMIINYGSTSWKSAPGVATHIYGEYELTPLDLKWNEADDGTMTRIYKYSSFSTDIYYPAERS
jgi:hypothetical protein